MSPSPNRQAVIVGLFVATSVAILAGGILTIGNLNDTFTRKIAVTAFFAEVNGLQQGDNVWFSGLKVGTVKTLGFLSPTQVEVGLLIDQAAAPFIHADSLAKIGSDGLIGNKIVVVYGGTPDSEPLHEGVVLGIGETISTEAIMEMLQENNTNLLAITSDLKGISAKLAAGEGTIGKLLADDELYVKVTDAVATLGAASENAREFTASLSTFSAGLNREGTLPHDLITDKTTYASLTATVERLKHAGERVDELVDGVASAAKDEDKPVGALLHDADIASDLKVTLDNLSRGSVLLNEDLKALQNNFLFRGYFRKQEKAAAKAAKGDDGKGVAPPPPPPPVPDP